MNKAYLIVWLWAGTNVDVSYNIYQSTNVYNSDFMHNAPVQWTNIYNWKFVVNTTNKFWRITNSLPFSFYHVTATVNGNESK